MKHDATQDSSQPQPGGTAASLQGKIAALFSGGVPYLSDLRRIYRILPTLLRRRFWFIMGMQMTRAFLETCTIFVIAMFTQSVSSPNYFRSRPLYHLITPYLPDFLASRLGSDDTLITTMSFVVLLFIILRNIIICATSVDTAVFSENVGLHVNREAYKRYLSKDYFWHISPGSKRMWHQIGNRAQLVSLVASLLQMAGNIICALVMFACLFTINPRLIGMVICVFVVVGASTYTILRKKVETVGAIVGRLKSQQGWAVGMASRGIREILIYRKQKTFYDNIINNAKAVVPNKAFLSISPRIPGWFLEISGFAIIFAVMYYMVTNSVPMPQIVGTMSLLLLTAWRVLPIVSRSMGLAVNIRGIHARAASCLELLESFTGEDIEREPEIDPTFHFQRTICLRDVTFVYPRAKKPSLRKVSLTIAKGERIAIIGKSGSGKSTLGMILAGLFQPKSGEVLVDDQEMTAGKTASYQSLIGYVPQNPLLLPGTIADNVALSRWGSEYDLEKMNRVCGQAAMSFIINGQKSLTFAIGDGGDGLSGGEAQRVSIARALYTDPEVLIFDEATSSLDAASENTIQETLDSLRGSVTAIVIAHRLSTVERCDRIVLMRDGGIAMVGTPEEVLAIYKNETDVSEASASATSAR